MAFAENRGRTVIRARCLCSMCAVGITRKLVRELAIDDLLGRKNDPTRDAITTAISFSHGNSRSTAYFGRLKKEREREKKHVSIRKHYGDTENSARTLVGGRCRTDNSLPPPEAIDCERR